VAVTTATWQPWGEVNRSLLPGLSGNLPLLWPKKFRTSPKNSATFLLPQFTTVFGRIANSNGSPEIKFWHKSGLNLVCLEYKNCVIEIPLPILNFRYFLLTNFFRPQEKNSATFEQSSGKIRYLAAVQSLEMDDSTSRQGFCNIRIVHGRVGQSHTFKMCDRSF